MSTGAIVSWAGAVLLVLWGIGAHNRLVRLRSGLTQAWTAVDAQLARRHALASELGALLGTPQAEAALADDELGRALLQSLQTLQAAARQAVTAAAPARARPSAAGAIQSLALAEQVLSGALRPLSLLIDARAAALDGIGTLVPAQATLRKLRELAAPLRFVRLAFNGAVAAYNGALDEMPTRLLAGPLGFRPAAPFHVRSTAPGAPAATDPEAAGAAQP